MKRTLFSLFRLTGAGPARVLGQLEARVMEILWERGQASLRDVASALGPEYSITTVMTILSRLTDKGFVKRSGHRRSYTYAPAYSRREFEQDLTRQVSAELVVDFGEDALAQFVDAAGEIDPRYLDEMERLIHAKRQRRSDP